MKELFFSDDAMAPKDIISLIYQGPNPYQVVGTADKYLRRVMEIKGPKVHEIKHDWNMISGSFFYLIEGNRTMDRWTKSVIKLIISGKQDPKTKQGKATVLVHAKVVTKFAYFNPIQKALYLAMSYSFYNRQRMKYLQQTTYFAEKIRDLYKEQLGMHLIPPPGA